MVYKSFDWFVYKMKALGYNKVQIFYLSLKYIKLHANPWIYILILKVYFETIDFKIREIKISAIIVIYNGMQRDWIQKCFESVLNSSLPIDIIAVDNGSTDGSVELIQHYYPRVDLIISNENVGFGKAKQCRNKKGF